MLLSGLNIFVFLVSVIVFVICEVVFIYWLRKKLILVVILSEKFGCMFFFGYVLLFGMWFVFWWYFLNVVLYNVICDLISNVYCLFRWLLFMKFWFFINLMVLLRFLRMKWVILLCGWCIFFLISIVLLFGSILVMIG